VNISLEITRINLPHSDDTEAFFRPLTFTTAPPPTINKLLLSSPIVGENEVIQEEEIEEEIAEKGTRKVYRR